MSTGARRLLRRLRGSDDQSRSGSVGTPPEGPSGQRQEMPTRQATAVSGEILTQQITPAGLQEQRGLHRVEPHCVEPKPGEGPDSHSRKRRKRDDATVTSVDIIAVHGLGGGAYDTWTHQNGNIWLRDVATHLPGARVYTYSYDARAVFSRSTSDLRDYARILLENIRLERESEEDKQRGIIFICHSMGGLVVKQALLVAVNESSKFPWVKDAFWAILFLGTPHQGSSIASYASILTQIVNIPWVGIQASRITGTVRTSLVRSLRTQEKSLLELAIDFRVHTDKFNITSFIEQETMQGLNERVVDDFSGFTGASSDRIIPLDGDHIQMCKLGSATSLSYRLIMGSIKEGIASGYARAKKNTTVDPVIEARRNVHWLVPRSVHPFFIGRQRVKDNLAKAFSNPPSATTPTDQQKRFVIVGLGGMGKSEVCLRFLHDHRDEFWGIFWITASDIAAAKQGYLAIGKKCGVPATDWSEVKTWLAESDKSWLLVVDNADDPDIDFSDFFPSAGGNIILTTRNPQCEIHQTVGVENLESLELDEARQLLLRAAKIPESLWEEHQEAATQVVNLLASHTLAVAQAGAFVGQGLCSLSEYPRMFKERREIIFRFPSKQVRSEYGNVYATFEISAVHLEKSTEQAAKDALELLHICSFMHFEGISEVSFKRAAEHGKKICNEDVETRRLRNNDIDELTEQHVARLPGYLRDQAENPFDDLRWRQACTILATLSLVSMRGTEDSVHLSMHPLAHSWAFLRQSPDRRAASWATASSVLALAMINDDYDLHRILHPHIRACLDHQVQSYVRSMPSMELAQMLFKFSWLQYQLSDYDCLDSMLQMVQNLISENTETDDGNSGNTMAVKYVISVVYLKTQRYQEAAHLIEDLMRIYEIELERDPPFLLQCRLQLARTHRMLGKESATVLLEQILDKPETTLAAEHPSRLVCMSELAMAYMRSGTNLGKSVELLEAVVEFEKTTLFTTDPPRLNSMSLLAQAYMRSGIELKQAVELLEEVVRIEATILAATDPDRLESMYWLARAYMKSGIELKQAVELLEEVVRIEATILATTDKGRLTTMYWLARAYIASGIKSKEAVELLEEVARIESILSIDEGRLTTIYWLAKAYIGSGIKLKEAVELLEEVVRIEATTLAITDPNRLLKVYWLAQAYIDSGTKLKEAVELLEEVVNIRAATADADDNLLSWARELLEEVLELLPAA